MFDGFVFYGLSGVTGIFGSFFLAGSDYGEEDGKAAGDEFSGHQE